MVFDNPAFTGDDDKITNSAYKNGSIEMRSTTVKGGESGDENGNARVQEEMDVAKMGSTATVISRAALPERDSWGNGLEFLMSCIAMSVGLGNVWRFPFTALENGGGAFLIPYLIVLAVVGRPIYYLEMIIGQFSSRGSAKVYDLCPAMRGAGYGQVYAVSLLSTYYASLMALIVNYLIDSFKDPLPWTECKTDWSNCISANNAHANASNNLNGTILTSSTEFYFNKEVLHELESIDNGIGWPNWKLTLFLAGSWLTVLLILIKGVRSSGKASYFLALFPYVVMGILLVRAVTLPGASDGILYFITPQWDKILDLDVWYAAVTQCFFSLSVCFGNIIMYASYNRFSHNIHRDATVVTLLDTFTSLIAGCTIFGILGNLAHSMGTTDVSKVVQGGAGLAFISYPDAISKFEFWPQGFSFLFFFMLFVLGVGSNVAMASCVMTVICDKFPKVRLWQAGCGVALFGFLIGLMYMTPGGQYMLSLVDFFGTSFIVFVLAIAELVAISWIYGVDRLCKDTEFMIGRNPGIYWRTCWGILTPLLMIVILIYTFITFKSLKYKEYTYPEAAIAAGWTIAAFGLMQLPIWAIVAIVKGEGNTLKDKIYSAFKPTDDWGPRDPIIYERYQKFVSNSENSQIVVRETNIFKRFKRHIYG